MGKKRMSTSPQRVYEAARFAIIILVALSVLNTILFMLGSDTMYVGSVFMSYYMVIILDEGVGLAAAAAILVPYVLAFFLSKRKSLWMLIALILFVLDTLLLIYVGITEEAFALMAMNLIAHAVVIVILAAGLKYSKAATEEDPDELRSIVPNNGQQNPVQNGDGAFTDVICSIAVSKDAERHTLEMPGVARFYENELALGTNNMAGQLMFGAALASTSERMRFAYTDIARAYFMKKNERTVRIDLNDGRFAYVVMGGNNRDVFVDLLASHGVTVGPFGEEPQQYETPFAQQTAGEAFWTCPICGNKNEASKAFCPSCGTKRP